jgi:quercetin dioxygenase-like cupin family protein
VHKHHHPGVEFLYIVSGKLALQIGAEDAELAEGTPFTFDSSVPHGYCKVGARRTTAFVVVTS